MSLCEVNLITPDMKARHRYEILIVVRDDNLAEYRRDMGRADKFKADQINILGGVCDGNDRFIEETVGSLRDLACILRENPSFDKNDLDTLSQWQDKNTRLIFSK